MRDPYIGKKMSYIKSCTCLTWLGSLFIAFLFSLNIHAQSCTSTQFARNYVFEGFGGAFFFDRLPSGEFYFGGVKNYNIVVRKADMNGNPIWNKEYKVSGAVTYSNSAFAALDSNGNYFINIGGECIGLLDANGTPLLARKLKVPSSNVYGISMGVLADNKKILLVNDQSTYAGNGYILICFSADLSTIVWSKHFSGGDTYFNNLTIEGDKIFVPGSTVDYGTLLCFDAVNGSLFSKKTFSIDNKRTSLKNIYSYKGGYVLQAYQGDNIILRLDDKLNVLNSYRIANASGSLAMATDIDGNIYGAYGSLIANRFAINNRDSVLWNRLNMNGAGYSPAILRCTPEGLDLLGSSNWYNVGVGTYESGIGISRSDYNGNFKNCTSYDSPFRLAAVSCKTGVSAIMARDTSLVTLLPATIIASDDITESWESCKAVSNCDTISIIGNKVMCNINSATFIARRNKDCFTPVKWIINKNSAVQTTLNDSTVSIQFSEPGSYTLIATLAGCPLISDTMRINVTLPGLTLDLGADTTICPGTNILLNAKKGFTSYLWQNGATDSTFMVTQPGIYHVKVTDVCGGIYRDTIIVNAHPPIPFDAGPDRIKCNNDTIHLNATPGFLNYEWFPAYHITSTTAQGVIVNPLADTIYTVKAEKTAGCFAYDTVHIKVNHSMPINLGADTSFCFGDSVIFNAGNNFSSYLWNNNMVSSSITVKAAGIYSVDAVSAEGCHSFDTVKVIKVFSNPVVSLDHNNNLCSGDTRLLDAGKFISYLWNDGSTGRTLLISKIGTYYVSVTDDYGCNASDTSFIIRINPLPTGFLPKDTAICSYGSLSLNAKTGFTNYLWSNNSTSPSITVVKPGQYQLQVTDNNRCVGKEIVTVSLKDCMEGFYIPNAFTPNNDGKNDVFKPIIFGNVTAYSFIIYNRFGQKVFESSDLSRGWNGSLQGINLPSDVFVWICIYEFASQAKEIKKGTVMLVR